jgi:hypothetical protein
VWALVLMVAWFGFWFLVNPGDNDNGATYVDVDSEQTDAAMEGMRPWIVWAGGALLLFVFMGVWSFVHLMRERGVKFEDLDPEEQARREEAGELLHNLGRPTDPKM